MTHDPNKAGLPSGAPRPADDSATTAQAAVDGYPYRSAPAGDDAGDPSSTCDTSNASQTSDTPHRRRIRSFVTRAGRVSTGQRRALDELGPRFVVPYSAGPMDWDAVFGRHAPRVLEIGFGMGATTAEIAAQRSGDDFIGVEVHEPGVGALLKLIGEHDLTNIRIVQHDAVEVIERMIGLQTLDGAHIFFPDPWHKARHHKRRLIQPPFVALLASRLKAGAYLHCATDWQNYAEQMFDVLSAESTLENTVHGYSPRPAYRPVTKFERRGLRLGHGVWDLVFRRRAN